MDYDVIYSRIIDLPPPFLRGDANFLAWQASQTLALANYCQPADSTQSQMVYSAASGGWLNVWGQLLGFPRNPMEADSTYQNRVQASLVAPVGSKYAIQTFATAYFGSSIIVTENNPPPGYTIAIPSFLTQAQLIAFAQALARIRPAGVPIQLTQSIPSFFFNTYVYWGASGVAGPYFGGAASGIGWPLGPNTNNSQPLLPTLILTDPILNGQTAI